MWVNGVCDYKFFRCLAFCTLIHWRGTPSLASMSTASSQLFPCMVTCSSVSFSGTVPAEHRKEGKRFSFLVITVWQWGVRSVSMTYHWLDGCANRRPPSREYPRRSQTEWTLLWPYGGGFFCPWGRQWSVQVDPSWRSEYIFVKYPRWDVSEWNLHFIPLHAVDF